MSKLYSKGIWKRLRSRLRTGNARVLVENMVSLSFLQVASYLFPMITLPYLARTIGVDKFGAIAFGASVIIYFQTVVDYGFNYTAVRDISKNRDDKKLVSEIFSSVIIIRFFLVIISFIILTVLIKTIPLFYENRVILYLTFLYLPGHVFFPDWFFQAVEKMKYITLMNVISKLFFTIMVFVVIREKSDFIYQPLLVALGYSLSGVVAMVIVFTRFEITFTIPTLRRLLRRFRGGTNMFLTLLLPNLYNSFSIILLRTFGGEIPTGIYSSGGKFIDMSNHFSSIFSRTFFPFLARRMDKHKLYRSVVFVASVGATIALFFGADLLVRIFYTPEFSESAKVIKILALSPLFFFLMDVYGTNYLVLLNKENYLRNIMIVCSFFGFALTWILVSKYSYIGAAIAIVVTRGIIGVVTWVVAMWHKYTIK